MGRFAVGTAELEGAAGSLGSVSGELGCGPLATGGGLGSGELDGALAVLAARLELVARAMDGAIAQTGQRLGSGADAYASTDAGVMPGGGR